MEALDVPNDGLEIKIRSQALAREVTTHSRSRFCWPHSHQPVILPWCPLVTMDSGTPPPSTPYMLLYKTERESIDMIYDKYKDDPHLEVIVIIPARTEASYEPSPSKSLPQDLSFIISIIPRKYKNIVMSLVHDRKDLEATVSGFLEKRSEIGYALLPSYPESRHTLFKALKYVLQNGIVVSLSKRIPKICPANKPLLVYFLETILDYYLSIESEIHVVPVYLKQELIFSLLLQHPVYYDSLFPKDFIFFFNIVDLERNFYIFDYALESFMMKCLRHLLLVPVETINNQLRLFVKHGDFPMRSCVTSLFEVTAESFKNCLKLYGKGSETIYVFLLLTRGIKDNGGL